MTIQSYAVCIDVHGIDLNEKVSHTVLVPLGLDDASHRRRPGREANNQVAPGDWVEPEGTAAPP